jgi:SPP1 family predicted phage head-tail adaptor
MQSGRFNKRVLIKRLTQTSDSYGGTTSTITTYKEIWAEFEEIQADVELSQGRQKQRLSVEFNVRKRTADLFDENDVLEIEGYSGQFRINGMFQSKLDQYTKINATKIV